MIRIFKVFVPTSILALLVSEACLIFGSYFAAVYLDPDLDAEVFFTFDSGLPRIAIVSALILAGNLFYGLYTNVRVQNRLRLLQELCVMLGVAFSIEALMIFVLPDWTVPRNMMIFGSAISLGVLFVWRLLFNRAVGKALGTKRVLFLGSSPAASQLAAHFVLHPELGLSPLGYVPGPDPVAPGAVVPVHVTSVAELDRVVDESAPEWILVGDRREVRPWWVTEFLELRFGGVETEDVARVYETALGRVCIAEIRPSDLIFGDGFQPQPINLRLQSIYSKALAMAMVMLSLPLMTLIAVLIKLSSKGPVLVGDRYLGLNGKPFTMFRFRMDDAGSGIPRLTVVGKFIARFRMSCLPQLFHVLRGQMSMVGPRAEREEYAARLAGEIPMYRHRLCVKPGITGWAQVNPISSYLRNNTLCQLEFDFYYIKNLSPSLDFFILLRTLRVALMGID
jgi:lipopolysaccharide/colanic/teichoic acid biosynthesis glycosyltransferase